MGNTVFELHLNGFISSGWAFVVVTERSLVRSAWLTVMRRFEIEFYCRRNYLQSEAIDSFSSLSLKTSLMGVSSNIGKYEICLENMALSQNYRSTMLLSWKYFLPIIGTTRPKIFLKAFLHFNNYWVCCALPSSDQLFLVFLTISSIIVIR